MEFIKKIEIEEGSVFSNAVAPNSIVLTNSLGTKAWNVLVKCKRPNNELVCKQLLRVLLAEILGDTEKCGEDCVIASKNKGLVGEFRKKCLSMTHAYITDRNGYIIPTSGLMYEDIAGEAVPLKTMFKILKSQPVYQLFVVDKLPWGHPELSKAVNEWVAANSLHMVYIEKFNERVGEISSISEKEEKELAKSEKEASTKESKEKAA